MTISEIIYKHLIEYRYNYRKGLINKFLILFLFPTTFYSYFNNIIVDAIENHPDQLTHRIIITVCFFGIAMVIILFIKPMSLILSSTIKKSKLLFKQDVFNYLKENAPEIEEMLPFQKISSSELLESGLFPKKDYDIEGDDWMKGHYKDVSFILSEINLFRYYKSYFYGAFVICDLGRSYPDTIKVFRPNENDFSCELISSKTINQIKELCNNYDLKIEFSIKNSRLYIAFWRHRNLFENNSKRAIENLGSDYDMFFSNIVIIRSLIDDLS